MSVIEGIRCNYATLSVAGTVSISTTPAFLHTINLNDSVAGTLTVKDGTAAAAATVGVVICGTPGYRMFDVDCPNGLQAITNANNKITISYAKI
jgi:hypothetical protein